MSLKENYPNRLEELFSSEEKAQPEPDGAVSPLPLGDEETIGELAIDVGDTHQHLKLVIEAGRLIAQVSDLDLMLEKVCDLIRSCLRVDHVQVYLTDASRHILMLQAGTGEIGKELKHHKHHVIVNADTPAGLAATQKQGLLVTDIETSDFFVVDPLLSSTRAEITEPLISGNQVLGVLDLHSNQPGGLTAAHHLVCEVLAGQLALAIENANLFAANLRTSAGGLTVAQKRSQASWRDFLDAVKRSEQIGYSFDLSEVAPLSEPLPTTPGERTLETPLQIGNESLGKLRIEGQTDQKWSGDEANLLASVVQQVTQHIENLRLLAQAQEYRSDAEQSARRLTRQGWQEFLNAIERDEQIGYTYDRSKVVPLHESHPVSFTSKTLNKPFYVSGEPVGSFQIESEKDQHWTEQQIYLMEMISQRTAQHIEGLRLLAQAERYRSEAEEATRRLTQEGWESYIQEASDLSPAYTYDLNRVRPVEPDTKSAANAAISLPLVVREETIGELAVVETPKEDDKTADLVSAIAERLSIHIESLRLLEETERGRQQLDKRAAELETVARVSTATSSVMTPDTLLQSVVDLTQYSFKLYHAHIYLLDEESDTLVLKAGAGKIGQQMVAEGHTIRVDQSVSVIAKAARTRSAVIVEDVRTEPAYLPHPLLPDTLSEMAIPLIVGDRLLGVFDVEDDVAGRFAEGDLQTYSTLAAQTAVALQNAQLYEEQLATVERLKELDHLKSSFLANMSHELRTPLNSILGFTQVMLEGLDGPLTEDMEYDLQLIDKNGQHLLALINDVLDMAKIEAGGLTLSRETLDLNDLLDEVLNTSGSLAREKSIYLKIDQDLPADMTIYADNVRMRQVMINLVGNAIKFTEQGGITIEADKNETRAQIRIRDTGIGIPPDKLESIFEAFSQVDTSTTRKVGGTGLGLPISRQLVELHGGRLWAESTGIAGEGSTFFLELPVDPSDKPVVE